MPQESVVVAEDERDIRALCVRALSQAGYDVYEASNGEEAVEIARSQSFDLLLTDINMPRMDGLEAYATIRTFNAQLVAVVMTGYGTLESAVEALKLGVYEFVLKPFTPSELLSAIERALSRRRLEVQNARLRALLPLFDLNRVIMNARDTAAVPRHILRIAREEAGADIASLLMFDRENKLLPLCSERSGQQELSARAISDPTLIARTLDLYQPLVFDAAHRSDPLVEALFGVPQVASGVCLPLRHKDQLLGVLNVAKTESGPPIGEADVEFLSVLAGQASVALENARLFNETQSAYERLAELDHLKSEFISIAAHELRTPLAVILAYATLLEEEATGAMQEHLSQVVQAAMQLKSVIDEMVSLQHIDTGQAQIELATLAAREVVEAALADLSLLAQRKNQNIQLDIPADLAPVYADGPVLRLILSNLISNAIKFTPERGHIEIGAYVEDERVVIVVSDTGVGIPEDEIDRVFDRFYQVEDSLRRKHGGIGLGLAIAREMAELIDGRLWAESRLHVGSSFYLSLPQARDSSEA